MILSKNSGNSNGNNNLVKSKFSLANHNHVYVIGFDDYKLAFINEILNRNDYYKVQGSLTPKLGLKYLRSIIPQLRHGIVIVTAELALSNNLRLIKQLKIINPQCQLLVLADNAADDAVCADFLHAGADGYFNLNNPAMSIPIAIGMLGTQRYYTIYLKSNRVKLICKPKISKLPKLSNTTSQQVLRVLRAPEYKPAQLTNEEMWLCREILNSFKVKTRNELLYAALKLGVIGGARNQ